MFCIIILQSSLKEHTSGLPDIKSVRFRHPIASYKDPPTEDELDKKPLPDYLQSQFKTKIYIQVKSHYVFRFPFRHFVPRTADKYSLSKT